jgi:hypothetical protein
MDHTSRSAEIAAVALEARGAFQLFAFHLAVLKGDLETHVWKGPQVSTVNVECITYHVELTLAFTLLSTAPARTRWTGFATEPNASMKS